MQKTDEYARILTPGHSQGAEHTVSGKRAWIFAKVAGI